jgi:hypothetical protein
MEILRGFAQGRSVLRSRAAARRIQASLLPSRSILQRGILEEEVHDFRRVRNSRAS